MARDSRLWKMYLAEQSGLNVGLRYETWLEDKLKTEDGQLIIPDVSGSIFTEHEIQLIHFALLNFPEQKLSKRTNGYKQMQRLADKVLKLL